MDIDQLAIMVKDGFDSVDKRFDGVNKRFDVIEQEMRDMRKEFTHELKRLREDIESLEHVTGFSKEIDGIMTRLNILEEKFAKKFA